MKPVVLRHRMQPRSRKIINAITAFRIVAVPFLLTALFTGRTGLFGWLLAACFCTDAIDGYLARKYRITSILGARLDSIGDDLTVASGVLGMILSFPGFLKEHYLLVMLLFMLYLLQNGIALYKFRKPTSYHTYAARVAAVLQGLFLIYTFISGLPPPALFYAACIFTASDLAEETAMALLMKKWKADVRSFFHAMKETG
jgi:CDP-diacylglycerol--glycerol-3-phosphate 3-phosphatidyltransferase